MAHSSRSPCWWMKDVEGMKPLGRPACPNRSDQSQVPRALGSPIVQIGPTLERFGLTTNNGAAHLGDEVRQTNPIPARND